MTRKRFSILLAVVGALSLAAIFSSYKDNNSGLPDSFVRPEAGNYLSQSVRAVQLPASADFAGEPLPMENFDTRERLDRELLVNAYWHSSTILAIKSLPRFFPTIERILAEEGVPDDFKYLAVAESSLRNETSPAGAKGIWQFMKETGIQYGLEINGEVDERLHLEKATRAACRYLKNAKDKYGSWTLAAAAYNAGGGRISSTMNDQRARGYYDLNLGTETSRYVFRIMALKEILRNPTTYGFFIEEHEKYPALDGYQVEVSTSVPNWGDFAVQHGVSYRTLKVYNPWLMDDSLANKGRKTYLITLPR
jgi:membrane-bound lytic murein transglycosylase D